MDSDVSTKQKKVEHVKEQNQQLLKDVEAKLALLQTQGGGLQHVSKYGDEATMQAYAVANELAKSLDKHGRGFNKVLTKWVKAGEGAKKRH